MKSATRAILLSKKSPAVQTNGPGPALFFLGIAVSIFFCYVCMVVGPTKQSEGQQDSIKYWKLKNALINVNVEDVVERQDGVSEFRMLNGSVEIRRR